ncbi:MAG: hypothetical protein LLG04_16605, partial [Parachlamydia sp.]|nr:hypothetical protein [Parachlamydia sp.]
KAELGLVCNGDGGSVHDKVEEIHVNFLADRRATLEEARALHLLAMEKLVQMVNNHQGIQSFLIERPFTHKRIEIMINFRGPYGHYYDGSIAYALNISELSTVVENRNCLIYKKMDPFTDDFIDRFQESYEEAIRLAQASPVKNPLVHQTKELETLTDQIFDKLARELAEKNHLYLLSIGGNMSKGIEEIGARFKAFCPTTIETARNYELFLAEKVLHAINGDVRLRPYLKEYPFPASRLKLFLEFRTKKDSWYTDDSLDHVTLENNVLTYFRIPPVAKREPWQTANLDPAFLANETYQVALETIRSTQKQSGSR